MQTSLFPRLLAIDPGISTGWALFDQGVLSACGARGDVWISPLPQVLVIEIPRVYEARRMKGDPNDLITLAIQAGRYIERYSAARVHRVFPSEWKGQVPKEKHHPKIYAKLSANEQKVVALGAKGLSKKGLGDMLDAVGIGQYAIRMGWAL